ncbi:YaeQ family protein [Rhodanobacter lindaniclasticus]
MALNSTIYKVELQISDMDRHYYATHALTLARHPSETEERLMVRLLAFALLADERLEFGKGLSDEDEPALWRKAYTDEIELWIDVGQPDEARIRKACGRARQVVVLNYGGNTADLWWHRNASALARHRNLTVLDIPAATVAELVALLQRGMRLQCLVQDGQLQLMNDADAVAVDPVRRMAPAETVA